MTIARRNELTRSTVPGESFRFMCGPLSTDITLMQPGNCLTHDIVKAREWAGSWPGYSVFVTRKRGA